MPPVQPVVPKDSSHESTEAYSLQRILQRHWLGYSVAHPQPSYVHRAAQLLMRCKTAAMGGHVRRCPEGHIADVVYNCCRHRCCPQCAGLPRRAWLAKWEDRMLHVPARHIVFTVPQDLVPIWAHNKKCFADALFQAAKESLLHLLADPKYLGALPGLLGVLHTWSQTLAAHPHCHFIVTSGGLDSEGKWKKPVKDCLLPRQVLMHVFRSKFLSRLKQLHRQGRVRLPDSWTELRWSALLSRLWQSVWNVKILERYAHSQGVMKYLAAYLRGGAIGNRRLLKVTESEVVFRYKNRRDPKSVRVTTTKVSTDVFLQRWSQHIPPKHLQTVRAYGLYSSSKRPLLAQAHQQLPKKATGPELTEVAGNRQSPENESRSEPKRCNVCGQPLIQEPLPRQHDWNLPVPRVFAARSPPLPGSVSRNSVA